MHIRKHLLIQKGSGRDVNKKEIISLIFKEISSGKSLMELRGCLIDLKKQGVSKEVMLECLNDMRVSDFEDTVLELMDFVEGFCNPQFCIF
ncbi:hypothetical protein AGJ34_02505 [Cronobacter dublinensis subsp. dublinensis]|nr:hypothetical protein [Cronobacter dublinensis subsp. dublinensis]EGT5668697.1 hypothetical protein [Cronobacter dublinensis subsp. dublinensis]EGT5671902.1 hypothetical protein [Cronobacter dublinensis subsp. dublinensis]EGT5676533.1 hypothetical protein [Cronobacter dublinensis subsp. dublinensis]EGT5684923.1 hypothetical protein [Cronobacter dublinensis subsp. dublinensis]